MWPIQRVLIITNIPNPYRIPLFNELQKQLSARNIHLKVVFGAETYSRRKFKLNTSEFHFDYVFLSSHDFHFGNNEKTFFTYSGLMKQIKNYQPDRIITNGFSIATIKLCLRSYLKRTNYIIWTGSIRKKGENNSLLRKTQRKLLMKRSKGYIVYGAKAKEYLTEEGIKPANIFTAINTVDTTFFHDETNKEKIKLVPDHKKHLTYLGYLVPRKKVLKLLEIIKHLAEIRNDFVLDIIGDGEDKVNLENFVLKNNLSHCVIFHGFKQKTELPSLFAKSSCFLFQTGFDVWGLVLNEAMAAGLPCLASDQAAASYDLIKDGQTGFMVNFDHTQNVIDKINFLLQNPEQANHIGKQAAEFILQNASLEKSAIGFVDAIIKL